MAVDLNALAAQSAAQGQQMLDQDNTNSAQYKSQGDSYQAQADAANKQVGDYTNYMANEGSAGNQYHNELTKQEGDLGYDPNQMKAATDNLNQSTGALSAYSDFANTGASKWGMNAGGFAAANSGALSGLNNNIASNNGIVSNLMGKYTTAQTGANQFTGQVVQGEQNTLAGYQQSYTNAANSRDTAYQQMNFWGNLAQQQGGLNSQQQQAYAAASASYAAASASLASARYAIAQSVAQEQANATASAAASKPAVSTPVKNSAKPAAAPAKNTAFNVNTSSLGALGGSLNADIHNGVASLLNWGTGQKQGTSYMYNG